MRMNLLRDHTATAHWSPWCDRVTRGGGSQARRKCSDHHVASLPRCDDPIARSLPLSLRPLPSLPRCEPPPPHPPTSAPVRSLPFSAPVSSQETFLFSDGAESAAAGGPGTDQWVMVDLGQDRVIARARRRCVCTLRRRPPHGGSLCARARARGRGASQRTVGGTR